MRNRLTARRCAPGIVLAAVLIAPAGAVAGSTPTYSSYTLHARTNFAFNPGGVYQVPGSWFFSGETIALNDGGDVAFRLSVTSGDFYALWVSTSTNLNHIAYQSPTGSTIGTPTINNAGLVGFEQSFSAANGIYRYDPVTTMTTIFTNRPLGASGWSGARINNSGQVGFRAAFAGSGNAFVSSAGEAFPPFHAAEVGVDSMSPYSFLFTPSFNNNRQIAGKLRLGGPGVFGESQPDEIRILNADGSSTLIARDRDADALSPYARFDNSVSLNDNGWVAFVASLHPFPSAGRGVFLSNGVTTLTIATTTGVGSPVSDVEFFAPAVNNAGLVAFRAFDTSALRAIWVGDGATLTRVVTEHDILPSDLGLARVDQNDSSPVFGGGPSINAGGDVAFNCALTPPSGNLVEWGTGVYVAAATPPFVPCLGDANGDLVVDFDDITETLAFWNQAAPEPFQGGDSNGDGFVDFDDITETLANWGATCK
jgi:hypothetical protein